LLRLPVKPYRGGSSTEAPSVPSGDGGSTGGAEAPIAEDSSGGDSSTGSADFPMPSDATNVMELGTGVLNFQTKSTLDECMAFYHFLHLTKMGIYSLGGDLLTYPTRGRGNGQLAGSAPIVSEFKPVLFSPTMTSPPARPKTQPLSSP
jgi:hypothetical protein